MTLSEKITSRRAKVAVVGLGYVGLPLLNSLLHAGFQVIGLDINGQKVKDIKNCALHGPFYCRKSVARRAEITTDFYRLQHSDIDIICVPTPVNHSCEPDISCVLSAARGIAQNSVSQKLVIVESTIPPYALREEILPVFAEAGLIHGLDYYLSYAPERIDPGNRYYSISNTPRVVGGMNNAAVNLTAAFYRCLVDKVLEVSTPETAEMVKVLENSYRCVNIAFINEIESYCRKAGIDIYEVINAAATKPFGFMPFYPGPGVGGHCITTDPVFLAWRARQQGKPSALLELALSLNRDRPGRALALIEETLQQNSKELTGAKVLLMGLAYKKNVTDMRDSPAVAIFEQLLQKGAKVSYYDPFIPEVFIHGQKHLRVELNKSILSQMDCLVITTDHDGLDYKEIVKNSSLIVDLRGVTGKAI